MLDLLDADKIVDDILSLSSYKVIKFGITYILDAEIERLS